MPVAPRFVVVQDTAARDLGEFSAAAQRAVDRVVHSAGESMLQGIQRAVPRRTGDLSRSYLLRTNKGFALVGSDLQRARFPEFGTSRGVKGNFAVHQALEDATGRIAEEIAAAIQGAI